MRFQSESPFLDPEALEFLRPSASVPGEAEADWGGTEREETPPVEGETRLLGRFRLRSSDPAAEPRRQGTSRAHESAADLALGELLEEPEEESSLPGHSRICVESRSETSEWASEGELQSDGLEGAEEGEARARGQLRMRGDDPVAEFRRKRSTVEHEEDEWGMGDPTGTLGEHQEMDESAEYAQPETPLD